MHWYTLCVWMGRVYNCSHKVIAALLIWPFTSYTYTAYYYPLSLLLSVLQTRLRYVSVVRVPPPAPPGLPPCPASMMHQPSEPQLLAMINQPHQGTHVGQGWPLLRHLMSLYMCIHVHVYYMYIHVPTLMFMYYCRIPQLCPCTFSSNYLQIILCLALLRFAHQAARMIMLSVGNGHHTEM